MKTTVADHLVAQLSHFVSDHMGLHFPPERRYELLRGIRSASHEFGFDDTEACVQWLLSAPLSKKQIEILAMYLTVGETYFFRETKMFEALENRVLPPLIRSRARLGRRLRFWSAGCCTGEEPYSIAILLHKMIPDLHDWNVTITATDINPHFLRKAQEGVYRDWSFRGTPRWVKEQYFSRDGEGLFNISSKVRKLVQFSYLNLMEDSYPSFFNEIHAMDLIFCRNVLMYFPQDKIIKVSERFFQTLMENGWLVVGSSEASHIFFPQFVTVTFPGCILYKKDESEMEAGRTIHIVMDGAEMTGKETGKEKEVPPAQAVPAIRRIKIAEKPENKEAPAPVQPKTVVPEKKTFEEALSLYERGLYAETIQQLDPPSPITQQSTEAMMLLSKAYANQGRIQEALEWCDRAIAMNKLDPKLYYLRAVIYQEQGRMDEAVQSLRRVLYLDSNYILAYFTLGNLTRQMGKHQEAEKHLQNAKHLLGSYGKEDVLPESEGLTAGRLKEIIQFMMNGASA